MAALHLQAIVVGGGDRYSTRAFVMPSFPIGAKQKKLHSLVDPAVARATSK